MGCGNWILGWGSALAPVSLRNFSRGSRSRVSRSVCSSWGWRFGVNSGHDVGGGGGAERVSPPPTGRRRMSTSLSSSIGGGAAGRPRWPILMPSSSKTNITLWWPSGRLVAMPVTRMPPFSYSPGASRKSGSFSTIVR